MSDGPGSVSQLISAMRAGDDSATTAIWERYRPRLEGIARTFLGSSDKSLADEEDVALIAFASVFQQLCTGNYPLLEDRHQLWKLLATVVSRRASNQKRLANRQKRTPAMFAPRIDERFVPAPDNPEAAVVFADHFEYLLQILNDNELRRICVLRLEGYRVAEVAKIVKRSIPTVERRLQLIRLLWKKELILDD